MADPEFPDPDRLNKAQKLVRILHRMQDGGVSSSDLMEDYGLDDRSLRRYISDLKDMGLPVVAQGRGPHRVWTLDASYRRQRVPLTLLELVSLHFGRTLFDFMGGTHFAEDADGAIERLSTFAGQGDLVRDLDRKFIAVREATKDYGRDSELIDEILTALLRQNPARALYARINGPTRAYHLRPYTLGVYRQSLYLFAEDVDEGKVKTFAVDRFRAFHRDRKAHFDYPEDYRPHDVVADAFGILGGPVVTVRLRFRKAAAPYIRERTWHRSQSVQDAEDGAVVLTMEVGRSYELISWILSFGPDVRVEAPADLAEQIQHLHLQAARGGPA
ncbi:transcriptional regulator [Myxococcota bacterium]|jgi:predicted DNA-binding transcriptional regulator YafY|nr:transcriptional regulator [Myxococcota bacterium]